LENRKRENEDGKTEWEIDRKMKKDW
jgi:hypothetical protein